MDVKILGKFQGSFGGILRNFTDIFGKDQEVILENLKAFRRCFDILKSRNVHLNLGES